MNDKINEQEQLLASAAAGDLQIAHRLKLRQLSQTLLLSTNSKSNVLKNSVYDQTLRTLTNFKASLKRRKNAADDTMISKILEVQEPARSLLLSDISFVFRNEIDNYTQIDFGDTKHLELLQVSINNSIRKVTNRQGRPINEALDEFFNGLRTLYEEVTCQKAMASAHFDGQPKTDFEKLMHLGYQIIRPAQTYPSALKAYQRALSRNS